MKKNKKVAGSDEMLPEYDFSNMKGRVRGKHYRAYRRGHQVTIHKTDGTTIIQNFKLEDGAVVLDQDVRKYFPDADAVNQALRSLIALIPQKPRKVKARTS